MVRLFFALDIEKPDQIVIAKWREQVLNLPFKKIPRQNFHITLAFLGSISNTDRQALIDKANTYMSECYQLNSVKRPLNLHLDHTGWFRKPKVIYLANSIIPVWLDKLANYLNVCASQLTIFQEERAYSPHISLYRKATTSADKFLHTTEQRLRANITITIKSFSLYQSVSTPDGVQYIPINQWRLS
ncbi:RNA 2',3'-cyclic phosphodiesterase [Colwelliaceae bacterium 6471]